MGLGHAVWCARALDRRRAVRRAAARRPDDRHAACTAQLVEAYEKTGGNVVAVMEVPREQTNRYGIAGARRTKDGLAEVNGLVEKPAPDGGAVDPGGDRPLRPACRRCSTISTSMRPAPAARSS